MDKETKQCEDSFRSYWEADIISGTRMLIKKKIILRMCNDQNQTDLFAFGWGNLALLPELATKVHTSLCLLFFILLSQLSVIFGLGGRKEDSGMGGW